MGYTATLEVGTLFPPSFTPGANRVRVVAVSRLGSAMLPTADLVVQEGDVIYLAVAHDSMTHLDELALKPPSEHGHHSGTRSEA